MQVLLIHDMTWHDMTWHDMTWHGMAWHDMTWHDMTWHDMTWHDMTWHDMTWHERCIHRRLWASTEVFVGPAIFFSWSICWVFQPNVRPNDQFQGSICSPLIPSGRPCRQQVKCGSPTSTSATCRQYQCFPNINLIQYCMTFFVIFELEDISSHHIWLDTKLYTPYSDLIYCNFVCFEGIWKTRDTWIGRWNDLSIL